MRDFRMDILRNNIPIGVMKCRSVSIKYDSTSEVHRGMQCVLSADSMVMTKVKQKVRDWIYFDGTRMFDGTWSFWDSIYDTTEYSFDMFSDRLRPVLIVDGQEFSLGTFMIIAAPKTLSETGSYYSIEAYDETMLLKQAALTDRAYYAEGTGYMSIISGLLTECGFGNIIADSSTATLQTDREFEIGETYIDIINELLEEMNYYPVYAGSDGYIYLKAKTEKIVPEFIYRDKNNFKLISTISENTDIYEKPNVLVGVISNPKLDPITYTKTNSDPTSTVSTVRRGYKVVKVYRMGNMASEADLRNFIDAEMLNAMQTTETIEFTTLAEPSHEYRSAVQIGTDLINGLFIETGWQIDLTVNSARMRHTAERKMFV